MALARGRVGFEPVAACSPAGSTRAVWNNASSRDGMAVRLNDNADFRRGRRSKTFASRPNTWPPVFGVACDGRCQYTEHDGTTRFAPFGAAGIDVTDGAIP